MQWALSANIVVVMITPGQHTVAQIRTSYISVMLHGPAKHSLLQTCLPTPQVTEHGDDSVQGPYTGSAKKIIMILWLLN